MLDSTNSNEKEDIKCKYNYDTEISKHLKKWVWTFAFSLAEETLMPEEMLSWRLHEALWCLMIIMQESNYVCGLRCHSFIISCNLAKKDVMWSTRAWQSVCSGGKQEVTSITYISSISNGYGSTVNAICLQKLRAELQMSSNVHICSFFQVQNHTLWLLVWAISG